MDIAQLAPLVAVAAAVLAFWSAANVERLKLSFDKARKAYGFHSDKEYQLYEEIYPKLLGAFRILESSKAIDSPMDDIEQLSIDLDERKEEDVMRDREKMFDKASEALHGFIGAVENKKPFISSEVYGLIEGFWTMGIDTMFVLRYPNLFKPPMQADRKASTATELKSQLDRICAAISSRLRVIGND